VESLNSRKDNKEANWLSSFFVFLMLWWKRIALIWLLAGCDGALASNTHESSSPVATTVAASIPVVGNTQRPTTTKRSVIIWEEEFPSESSRDRTSAASENTVVPRRKIWSTNKEEPLSPFAPPSPGKAFQDVVRQPHRLRTDRWELHIHWRGKKEHERLEMEFSDNGFVRMISDDETSSIGQWELASHGLTWRLPMPDQDRLIFHGDLLLNPFGPQPKIIRGIVLRETRRVWFRPVVASFTGNGTGEDTADLSYRNRKSTI